MAPFQENKPKYMEFCDTGEEYREQYDTQGIDKVKLLSGALLDMHDPVFKVPGSISDYLVPDSPLYQVVHVPFKEMYPTFERFMEEYVEADCDEDGNYGYWRNPNAKWDWCTIGGRWPGMLKASGGVLENPNGADIPAGRYDIAQIRNIDFSPDQEIYQTAIRFWEVYIERQPLLPEEEPGQFQSFWKPEYYTCLYGDKESYAKTLSGFDVHAFITPAGEWVEKGEMGWFGHDNSTRESIAAYFERLYQTLKETPPEHYIAIVDCHI
jgi:hypothetical protein